jgi:hypothetical protein
MTPEPKLLVIDKDIFRGTKRIVLEAFVKNHFLVLPKVLFDEVFTTNEARDTLKEDLRSAILAGGYICPPSGYIIRKEAETLKPYGSLPDDKGTTNLRKIFKSKKEFFAINKIGQIQDEMNETAKLFKDFVRILSDNLTEKLRNGFRKLSGFDTCSRIVGLMELVDKSNIHDIAVETMEHLTKDPTFCSDKNWISWQYVRLRILLHYEHLFKMQINSEINIRKVEHDCMDMEYALLLSRADGLLSKDKFIQALVKAAFPKKNVFSSLEEIPEDYVCHWN